jgi:hypothetical protein
VKLFGYLPETLFQPLAGPKKHVYARLLLRLYERLFAVRVLETPTKDEVLRHIASALPEAGVNTSDQLQEDGIEDDTQPYAHYVAYNRLRNTGWLVEEQEKWEVLVDMHPDAFMLLGAIADFANSRVRVAGAVVEVKSNLEVAAKEPESMAQGLANACETAVRFARSMRRILLGMRDIEDKILGNPDAGSILRTFFRDFVDGLLIADYKQLKTSNNPYRYRRQISALASELLHDIDRRAKLARAYIDQGVVPSGSSIATAEERIVGELEKIRQVFEDVGPFMDRIEDFRDRLERRVRTTVHYMDVMGEGSAERLARVIERLAAIGGADIELRLRSPDVGFPISERALYTPPPPRSMPEKTRFKMPKRDPYLKAYVAATTAFDSMVRVTPARMTAFINAKIGDRGELHSSEIKIETIEELLAFRSLRAALGSAASAEIGSYRVVVEDGRTDNEWINLPSFRIERAASEAA